VSPDGDLLDVLAALGPDGRAELLTVARGLLRSRALPPTDLPDDQEPSAGDVIIAEVDRAVG
jgi:hypothetical protein